MAATPCAPPEVCVTTPTVTLCILSDRPAHLRVLLASLRVQTVRNWSAVVLDQGIGSTSYHEVEALGDPRITWQKVPRRGDWGQAEKYRAACAASAVYVGVPNDDAYYCPRYLELMVDALQRDGADLAYCDWVSAADAGAPYIPYRAEPVTGRIDVGGFLVRRELLAAHGWPDRGPTGDGALIESLVRRGARHVRVPAVLYTKN